MSKIAGDLLWNRKHITLIPGTTQIDTAIVQVEQAFEPGQPVPPTRLNVIPMSPIGPWASAVSHGNPYKNPTTGTMMVAFTNSDPSPVTINVLFHSFSTLAGPGQADAYAPPVD